MIEIIHTQHDVQIQHTKKSKESSIYTIFSSDFEIEKMIVYKGLARVVLMLKTNANLDNKNVICIDYLGELMWRTPNYTNINYAIEIIYLDELLVKIINQNKSYWILKVENGELVVNPNESLKVAKV
jgi:hypothetical protein